jgi:hypothetical protein
VEEDVELIDEDEDTHAVAAYYAEGGEETEGEEHDVQFDERLGLAIEGLQEGITLDQLWRVI